MNIDEKQKELIARLNKNTENGSITWTSDAEDTSFSATVPPGYTVRIRWPREIARLQVFNASGQEILSEEEDAEEPPKGIMTLWHNARNNALGIDKALDDLLDSLQ